ncbi:unnamed protein product [Mytilus edulis]|uniref:Fibrinogen C-terminal domain-containing protein n=1 Tax=Mytilus edulis TaxID=6550 RepID=A0A8S3PXQ8_MYTED|nr:unnamed protein product [Mytilus edulis]
MIISALITIVCLFGNAKLQTNSSRQHCVPSRCHTGVCFYGKAAERILVLAKSDWYPECHKGQPHDCNDIPDWCPNGVYKVYPRYTTGFKVYCEMKIDGGHWTVFQRRENGYVDFLRGWNDYKHGFGYLKHEFWLGNSLEHHNGYSFSTRDQDNDNAPNGNCSTWFPGGWWYNRCVTANLNGVYFIRTPVLEHRGVYWRTWKGINYSLKNSVMMLRRL